MTPASTLSELKDLSELHSTLLPGSSLPSSVMDIWSTIPASVRSALVAAESLSAAGKDTTDPACPSAAPSFSVSDASLSSDSGDDEKKEPDLPPVAAPVLTPLPRAPRNVFTFATSGNGNLLASSKGWRNVFTLPISYDVTLVPPGSLLDPASPRLLDATGPLRTTTDATRPRRFAAVDDAVYALYGERLVAYFAARGVDLTVCVLQGGEDAKRPAAVDALTDALCAYGLLRREPFLAIGGGCLLDIAGLAACTYRRGVPFVRVPTTLLALVDASVGVKNGVDYCCTPTQTDYKNRVGSFYAPAGCLLDASFIATQDARNISNGFGEIIKLALVRSDALFALLEVHGASLVASRFGRHRKVPEGVSTRIIELSIQIMLEELGPNLWEKELDRCVDYGHTFSKLLEMVPHIDLMHGEAVNIDGFLSLLLSYNRGWITRATVARVHACMHALGLPTHTPHLTPELCRQSLVDAVEHRNGAQRLPLITAIGRSVCVSDVTEEEVARALEVMEEFAH